MPSLLPIPRAALSFYEEHCIFLPAMLGWFIFSAALSTYNKVVFGETHMHFPCPLLLTSFHFLVQWVFSYTVTELFCRDAVAELKTLSWRTFLSTSIPCGLVTALDVGLSNLSLVYITMTFYTMVKSATPVFVLLWAYIFRIERITYSLIGVVMIITLGEFLTVIGEAAFNLVGFSLCLTAAVLSGARWTLVQLKLRSLPVTLTTLMTMRWLAPSMFCCLIVMSIVIEHPWTTLATYNSDQWLTLVGLGILGGCVAVAMVLCEFYLILKANAFMLMIGGVLKEMVTIVIGVSAFHDQLNLTNSCGLFVVFLGVAFYKLIHYNDNAKPTTPQATDGILKETSSERGGLVTRAGKEYATVEKHETTAVVAENDTLLHGDGWIELRKNEAGENNESASKIV